MFLHPYRFELFCSKAKRSTGQFVLFRYSQPRSIEFFYRRLYFEFTRPESTLSILGTFSAKVIERRVVIIFITTMFSGFHLTGLRTLFDIVSDRGC